MLEYETSIKPSEEIELLLEEYESRPFNDRTSSILQRKYGALINHYVTTILKSKLLTDEDLEALVYKYENHTIRTTQKYQFPKGFLLFNAASATGLLASWKLNINTIPSILWLFTAYVNYNELKHLFNLTVYQTNVKELIQLCSEKIHQNNSILTYLKTRCGYLRKQDPEVNVLKRSKSFIKRTIRQEFQLIGLLKKSVIELSKMTPILYQDYQFFKDHDFEDLEEFVDDICGELIRCNDFYLYYLSKFLSNLCIVFLSDLSKARSEDIKYILDDIVPNIISCLKTVKRKVQQDFCNIRSCKDRVDDFKARFKNVKNSLVPRKLRQVLYYSASNISLILEKSENILFQVENAQKELEMRELESAIADLRDHTYATYESLNLLSKIFTIVSNTKPNDSPMIKYENVQNDPILQSVKFDDCNEPLTDEQYEMYIGEDEEIELPRSGYEDSSAGLYLGCMLEELRQSLKQHKRFIAARERRGSLEESQEIRMREEVPKFVAPPAVPELKPAVSPNPPRPPPLPSFKLEGGDGRQSSCLLDNIRAFSSQRELNEEVFADSGEESGSGSEDC